MGKQRTTTLILGEGPTEFYYFKSLCEVFKNLTIQPDYPKHTSIKDLDKKISDGINEGFRYIFCIIDMDNKSENPEKTRYASLKAKYSKPIIKPKKGLYCEVKFFETHLCSELFFLYYFRYSTRMYTSQDALLEDLNQNCNYQKKCTFFNKCGGLHSYFERKGGKLESAITNANKSSADRQKEIRDYTYSELGLLFEELKKI